MYRLARTHCTNPSCRIDMAEVVEDAVITLMCERCHQYNSILSRESIGSGRCELCKGALDDHKWQGEFVVCRS